MAYRSTSQLLSGRMAHPGLGLTLQESINQRRNLEQRAADERRIFEAEEAQKKAAADTEQLQGKVLIWAPRVAVGLAIVIGAYFFWKKRKGG